MEPLIVLADTRPCSLSGSFLLSWCALIRGTDFFFYPAAFVRLFVLWQLTWWFRKLLNWFSGLAAEFKDITKQNKRFITFRLQFSGSHKFSGIGENHLANHLQRCNETVNHSFIRQHLTVTCYIIYLLYYATLAILQYSYFSLIRFTLHFVALIAQIPQSRIYKAIYFIIFSSVINCNQNVMTVKCCRKKWVCASVTNKGNSKIHQKQK